MMTYEQKVDPNTGSKYVELTEDDGIKYIDNMPDFKDEEEKKAYFAHLEELGYKDIETVPAEKDDK